MFNLRACMLMGWVLRADFEAQTVALALSNGKTVSYSRDEFDRLYRIA
jgi:hypothetical protein